MNIFEKATKLKLRFTTGKGEASIEDLWDLSLQALDTIAKAVNKQLKDETEESFIERKSTKSAILELKLDVLKKVIEVKQEEAKARKERSEKASRADFMRNLLEKKRMDKLEALSEEDIEKELASLEETAEETTD